MPALAPILDTIASLTQRIQAYDRQIQPITQTHYPGTRFLRDVPGVGPLTSLGYILTLEDPQRFRQSREIGACLGLVPRSDQSGAHDPQLHITKTGDSYLRRLLVQSAQYILGPFGPDCDLRRWGLKLAARGGNPPRNAWVGRKLAVLLHHLWKNGEIYDPLCRSRLAPAEVAIATG